MLNQQIKQGASGVNFSWSPQEWEIMKLNAFAWVEDMNMSGRRRLHLFGTDNSICPGQVAFILLLLLLRLDSCCVVYH